LFDRPREHQLDVLADILGTVRLRSTVFVQTELAAPWGMRSRPRPDFAFHIISRGRAWLEVDGLAPVEVHSGDVVLLRPGLGHSLRDSLDTTARDLMELLAEGRLGPDAAVEGNGASTQLVCGCFRFDDLAGDALTAALPMVLHTGDLDSDVGPWLAQTVRLLTYETRTQRPGGATVINRLCDALFVYLLRSHLEALPASESNWLRALAEPDIGAALQLMHDNPARPWTVAALAAKVGLSRSAFAARFTRLVGEPPMQYLMRWRVQKAAAILREGEADIGQVAARVGYESAAAFSKAFKRATGSTPGALRRRP
jgi:AraC-like DNA-binding protein